MYTNKPNGFRSSFRGASLRNINSQNRPQGQSPFAPKLRFSKSANNFRRPFNNNRFNNNSGKQFNRSNGGQRRQSKLIGADVNIFIKKASGSEQIEYESTHSFSEFNLATPLKANIINKGYQTPTPIQDQAITPILEGKDLIGIANTGTGKTAAFLIPLINKVFTDRNHRVLIVVPTRELANQISDEFRSFAAGMSLYSSLIIGGSNMKRQIHEIRRNPHFVIATPGRLKDLVEQGVIRISDFDSFVLDEVDLMVDIGFLNDVKYFISLLPENRQSLFFSATIPNKVKDILYSFVNNPITVSVKQQDTSENVEQDIIKVTNKNKKIEQLHDLLNQKGFDKVLIFGRTKHGIEKLYRELQFRGFQVGAIHGNKSQGQRQRTLQSFKQNQIKILLATDVASRGLDIDQVTHVINYELPENYEDYIHRIGRTGRADNKGNALTFID